MIGSSFSPTVLVCFVIKVYLPSPTSCWCIDCIYWTWFTSQSKLLKPQPSNLSLQSALNSRKRPLRREWEVDKISFISRSTCFFGDIFVQWVCFLLRRLSWTSMMDKQSNLSRWWWFASLIRIQQWPLSDMLNRGRHTIQDCEQGTQCERFSWGLILVQSSCYTNTNCWESFEKLTGQDISGKPASNLQKLNN